MAAIDMLRNSRYYSPEDIDAPRAASPERPTMQPGEHLGPQFADVTAPAAAPATRHPLRIGSASVHEYLSDHCSHHTRRST